MIERTRYWIGAGLLLVIGVLVRAWAIGAEPLWLDEAYSAYAAGHGFDFLWHVVPRYETHPPFYYSLLRIWAMAFGDGVGALRAIGLIAGLATVPLVVASALEAGRRLGWLAERRRRLALAALALACVSIPLVEMSRQVRPYALLILVYAGATLLLLRLDRARAAGARIGGRGLAGYLLLLEAMLWLHNMGPLFAVASTLALAAAVLHRGMSRRDLLWLVGGHLLVGLIYLPAFLILLDQAPVWVGSTWLRFSWSGAAGHLQMLYAAPGWPGLAGLVLLGLALAAAWRVRQGRRVMLMLLALTVVPVVLSIGVSLLVAPVFITRTMTPVAVPTLVLFALGATAWSDARRWLGLGGLLILAVNMLSVDIQERQAGPMQNWYPAVRWLAARFRSGDLVFAYPNEGALPLDYALRDEQLSLPVRAIPAPVPAFDPGGIYVTGSRGVVSLPRPRLRAIAGSPATRAVSTVWLLRLGPETYDPGNVFVAELRTGRRIVGHYRDGPIDIIGLARDPTPPPGPARNRR